MKRKIISSLQEWSNKNHRKPLILLGARQVGKTWALKHFGKECYESVAYVNCDQEPLTKELFLADYDINRILLAVQSITGVKVVPGKTLIIFDEIQEAPRGIHSLKYFCENAPEYHVAAAGSLLGVALAQKESFPVGKVDMMKMYPMDFDEFLMANGDDSLLEVLEQQDHAAIGILRNKLIERLRQYYFVGGMPEVVDRYVTNRDLGEVRAVQEAILESYRMDISKHCGKSEAVRIGQVFDSIVPQLTKENKKFQYGVIKKGARSAQYELAIQWLIDSGIVTKVTRVSTIKMPLKAYEDVESFKLFLLDCGLFGCLAGAPAAQLIVGQNAFTEFKGAFTEQYVHQQFAAIGHTLHYWSNDRSQAEIDFVAQSDTRVIPIEVKAETNVRAKSMSTYIKDNPSLGLKGIRISMNDYIDQGWMENVPLYAFPHHPLK